MNHRNFAQTTLAAAITDTSGTSITVTSETSFPAAPFIISIDTECLLVTVVSGTTWTVTRGYESSTAATHLNGAVVYHDWSAGEADSTVHGPASSTDGNFALYDGGTGKKIKDGPALVTTVGATGDDTSVPTEQAVREAIAAIPSGLPTTGGTMSGAINMGNQDISYLKLLKLNGEIDDGNSGTAKTIDWNAGAAHKSTLTGNVTFAFTGASYVVPDMTSDTAPSGVCSSSLAGLPTWKVFDRDDATYPYTGGFAYPGIGDYLQYAFPEGTTAIASGYDWKGHSATGATAWTVQGSNNGTDFVTLDVVTGHSGSAKTRYAIDTPAAYRYYRVTIDALSDAASIDGIDFLAVISDPPAPCFLTLKLVQDGTGGRTVTWPATVKGNPIINQAANSVSNVLFYWDGTSYWTLNGLPWVGVPASASAAGFAGQMAYDASYIYVCTAANTWKRVAIATW